MKARIDSSTQKSIVVVEYDDVVTGSRRRREFMAPPGGGYVREWSGGSWKQVCYGLSGRGATLRLGSDEDLLAIIRREYRAMRRAEKKILG